MQKIGRVPESGTVAVEVAASPAQVWAVVGDPTRTGEWSHEARHVEWRDGASRAVPGARFSGTSESGRWRWTRRCEITSVVEGEELVWRTIPHGHERDVSEWTIRISPAGSGTRIEQSFRMVKLHPLMARLFWLLLPAHRDRTAALREDLVRIGDVAARADAAVDAGHLAESAATTSSRRSTSSSVL